MIDLCCEKHEVGERNAGPIKKLNFKVQLGRERNYSPALGRRGCKKSQLAHFACNKTDRPKARIKEENRTILTLELCRSETEVRCRMQGMQEGDAGQGDAKPGEKSEQGFL